MTRFQLLDLIADNVTRVMALVLIALGVWDAVRRRYRTLGLLAMCIFLVYGLRWLDARFGLWGSLALDYSTHTAAATALALVLGMRLPHWRIGLACLTLGYFALMRFQGYHGIGDIASTAAVVVPLMAVVLWWAGRAPGAALG